MTLNRDIASGAVWYPYTPVPHLGPRAHLVKAQDQYVYTEEGKRVFDATSSWWCNLHGHGNARIIDALTRQARTLDHVMMAPHSHSPAIELAEKLLFHVGSPFKKVFFSDDGSTAVEAALKMVLQYWHLRGEKRTKFVNLDQGYHGDTLGSISVSGTDVFHHYFYTVKMPSWRIPAPYCYRCPVGKTYPSCNTACLDSVEEGLKKESSEIAGLVIEPLILGAGGMISYPKDYLIKIIRLFKSYHIPIIFDEVFTGFGRTGKMFALSNPSCTPDIVCLSKGLTNGVMPMGATITTQGIYEAFLGGTRKTFYHGHTFTGNPLGAAIAIESLKIFEEEKTLQKNESLIKILAAQESRFKKIPIVGDVRGVGMIWAIELKTDSNVLGWKIAAQLWENGCWIRPLRNVLYIVPPYCSTAQDLNGLFSCLEDALTSM